MFDLKMMHISKNTNTHFDESFGNGVHIGWNLIIKSFGILNGVDANKGPLRRGGGQSTLPPSAYAPMSWPSVDQSRKKRGLHESQWPITDLFTLLTPPPSPQFQQQKSFFAESASLFYLPVPAAWFFVIQDFGMKKKEVVEKMHLLKKGMWIWKKKIS